MNQSDETPAPRAAGGCLCGRVRYRVTGPLRQVVNCHCSQCRRTHGHFAAYTNADKHHVEIIEDGSLKWYPSSDTARRGFCGECGSSLFWEPAGGDTLGIAAGTLDSPTGLRTIAHLYIGDRSDYYDLDDDLPHFPGASGDRG
jgi:hypothetical protein